MRYIYNSATQHDTKVDDPQPSLSKQVLLQPLLGEPLSLDVDGFSLEATSAIYSFVAPANLAHAVKLLKHLQALALAVRKIDPARCQKLAKVRNQRARKCWKRNNLIAILIF